MHPKSWLMREPGQASVARTLRLFCFSYAGGSAGSYLPWQAVVDPSIEICAVQLPGRGARLAEQPYTSLPHLIEALAQVIARESKLPFAFFGHSLGGLVAFELARYCKRQYLPMPVHLIVSGCSAPQFRRASRQMHELDDDALIEVLRDYNGSPPEVLANRELMTLLLPTIRADFALAENYKYRPGPPLTIPISVLAGKRDDHDSPDQTNGWSRETTNTCRVHWFEGDHFFIQSEREAVLNCLNNELAVVQCA